MANTLDQYPGVGADTFAYDANGNLSTGRGGASYSHNSDNQLVSASVSGTAVSYAYDARGRRVAKTVGGVTTRPLPGPFPPDFDPPDRNLC